MTIWHSAKLFWTYLSLLRLCLFREISGYHCLHFKLGWFWSKKNRQISFLLGKCCFKGTALYLYRVKWKMLFKSQWICHILWIVNVHLCSLLLLLKRFFLKKGFQLYRYKHNSHIIPLPKVKKQQKKRQYKALLVTYGKRRRSEFVLRSLRKEQLIFCSALSIDLIPKTQWIHIAYPK